MTNSLLHFSRRTAGAIVFAIAALVFASNAFAGGNVVPTDQSQDDFQKAYKAAMYHSYVDYRFSSSKADADNFPLFGEESVYWAKSGPNRGAFIIPNAVNSSFASASRTEYDTYNRQGNEHYSLQYKPSSKRVAIFQSDILMNNKTVSWQAMYFKNAFASYLYGTFYYYLDEEYLDSNNISSATQLLIIPSFAMNGTDNKYYIDSVFNRCPAIADRINTFLARGGTIYAEGNAVYFLEKLGFLEEDAVNFENSIPANANNLIEIDYEDSDHPLAFTEDAVGDYLYATSVPLVLPRRRRSNRAN
jgi:hypothetical protein